MAAQRAAQHQQARALGAGDDSLQLGLRHILNVLLQVVNQHVADCRKRLERGSERG